MLWLLTDQSLLEDLAFWRRRSPSCCPWEGEQLEGGELEDPLPCNDPPLSLLPLCLVAQFSYRHYLTPGSCCGGGSSPS
jgi:hypothetical protein